MKKLLAGVALASAFATAPAMAVTYAPVGPQTNVALSNVTNGGWTLCHQSTMDQAFGTSAATTLAGCTGDLLLLAGRETGSDTLLALAYAPKADALFNTGAANNGVFHNANGSDWFYADSWSWGFKTPGTSMDKFQCDFTPPDASMCIHTLDVGGFSINGITGFSPNYERLVFTANGLAVPEPASWAMMIGGFALLGAAMRRRVSKVAFA